jgi:hypothetical protein
MAGRITFKRFGGFDCHWAKCGLSDLHTTAHLVTLNAATVRSQHGLDIRETRLLLILDTEIVRDKRLRALQNDRDTISRILLGIPRTIFTPEFASPSRYLRDTAFIPAS